MKHIYILCNIEAYMRWNDVHDDNDDDDVHDDDDDMIIAKNRPHWIFDLFKIRLIYVVGIFVRIILFLLGLI